MIGNVHGNDTPPSGSQHIMLHVMYSTRALPRAFGKMTFLKNWKKNISRSSLNELATHAPNAVGVNGHCVAPDNVSSLVVTRGKAPKALTILWYFKLESS